MHFQGGLSILRDDPADAYLTNWEMPESWSTEGTLSLSLGKQGIGFIVCIESAGTARSILLASEARRGG